MATDNFPAIQLGGKFIDFDNFHSICDSGTITSVSNVANGSIIVTGGTITSLPDVVLEAGTLTIGNVIVDEGTIVIGAGTISAGTLDNLASGSIVVTAGTISAIGAGTITMAAGTISAGTLDNLASGSIVVTAGTVAMMNAGTLDTLLAGTVSMLHAGTLSNINAGTISTLNSGTIDTLLAGTISTLNSGTIDILAAGTLTNLASGSVVITAGTISAGTLDNLASGSVVITAGTISAGTLDNLASGSIVVIGGTITKSISETEYFVENGAMFTASDYIALASGGTRLITLGTAGAGTIVHAWPIISSQGAVNIRIIEGGTTTPVGALNNFNRDRNSANVSDTEWITGTVLTGGTVILTAYGVGGQGPKAVGGETVSERGWKFMVDTETCIEIVDASADSNVVAARINWHE